MSTQQSPASNDQNYDADGDKDFLLAWLTVKYVLASFSGLTTAEAPISNLNKAQAGLKSAKNNLMLFTNSLKNI